jgi:hypothetical protein
LDRFHSSGASIPIYSNGSYRASGLPKEFQSQGKELYPFTGAPKSAKTSVHAGDPKEDHVDAAGGGRAGGPEDEPGDLASAGDRASDPAGAGSRDGAGQAVDSEEKHLDDSRESLANTTDGSGGPENPRPDRVRGTIREDNRKENPADTIAGAGRIGDAGGPENDRDAVAIAGAGRIGDAGGPEDDRDAVASQTPEPASGHENIEVEEPENMEDHMLNDNPDIAKVTNIDFFWTMPFHDFPKPKTPVDHYFSKAFWKKSFDLSLHTNTSSTGSTSQNTSTIVALWNSLNDWFFSPNDLLHIDQARLPVQSHTPSFWKVAASIAYTFFIPQVNQSTTSSIDTYMSDSWFYHAQFDKTSSNGTLWVTFLACGITLFIVIGLLSFVHIYKRSLTQMGEMFAV